MADLSVRFAGIRSPNPFWLASGPPTNSADQVMRAFDAGWGGAVWKTLGDPIVDTSSRFGALHVNGTRMVGFNNIELITDRPLEVNLREIREVKRKYPTSNPIYHTPLIVGCDAPFYTVHRVTGGCYIMNPTGAPVPCGVAVTPRTWTEVKSLYD